MGKSYGSGGEFNPLAHKIGMDASTSTTEIEENIILYIYQNQEGSLKTAFYVAIDDEKSNSYLRNL